MTQRANTPAGGVAVTQGESKPKCTPESLQNASDWLAALSVADLAVGKVPYVRVPAIARDQLADLMASAVPRIASQADLLRIVQKLIEITPYRTLDPKAPLYLEMLSVAARSQVSK